MAGGIGILGGYGLRTRTTATRWSDIEEYVHRLANQSLQMDSSGNVDITGVINIGTSGGIYQGTGTFASPTTGLKIYNSGGIGLIAGYNAGTVQWYADTDGKLYAGAGAVMLDSNGISIGLSTGYSDTRAYRLANGSDIVGVLQGYALGTPTFLDAVRLRASQRTGYDSYLYLEADAVSGETSQVFIAARVNGVSQADITVSELLGQVGLSPKARVYGDATVDGGLNIGTATGAGAGAVYAYGAESHFTNGSYSDPHVGTAYAIKASGGIASNNIYSSNQVRAVTGFLAPLSNASAVWGIDANATGTSVADTATYQPFGNTNAFSGLFLVNALDSGSVGLFMQGGNTVVLISESVANTFSITQGTASRVNVYLATNVVTIENRRGVTVEIRTFAIRTRNSY